MKKSVTIKKCMGSDDVVKLLDDLLRSIRQGKVVVEDDREYVALTPSELMDVEVEAGVKKGKEKLVIELAWRTPVRVEEAEPMLRISSSEPAPAEEEAVEVTEV